MGDPLTSGPVREIDYSQCPFCNARVRPEEFVKHKGGCRQLDAS